MKRTCKNNWFFSMSIIFVHTSAAPLFHVSSYHTLPSCYFYLPNISLTIRHNLLKSPPKIPGLPLEPSPLSLACSSIHSLSHLSLLIFWTDVTLSTTSPLSKTNKLGNELTMKSIGTLEPMISGASNSTSANLILFSGSTGHGGVVDVRILFKRGEMVLHGGQ